jgi:organic hydroperoxide reductase OsmC/OhrA
MAVQTKKIEFKSDLSWDGKSGGEITLQKGSTIHIDMPKEFGGEGRYLCPDELFFSAIGGCILTTFLYMREKLKFDIKGLRVSVTGNVESQGAEGYRVTGADVKLTVETDEEGKDKAQSCVEMTKKFCHITRSIEKTVPITVATEITGNERKK